MAAERGRIETNGNGTGQNLGGELASEIGRPGKSNAWSERKKERADRDGGEPW